MLPLVVEKYPRAQKWQPPATPGGKGWLRLGWPAYNQRVGEIRPAVGNLDTDPREEIVLGLASGGAGFVQLRDDAAGGFAPLALASRADGFLQLGWTKYNTQNGETWPAVCDLNGDHRGEVVMGVGAGGAGFGQIRDSGGWFQVGWTKYNVAVGEVRPTCGDLGDADTSNEELVLGLGTGGAGFMEVKDDLDRGLANLGWVQVPWTAYNTTDGLTRPAAAR